MKQLVTGAAGFIGSVVVRKLLEKSVDVVGVDNVNDYYDVRLKRHRIEKLDGFDNFEFIEMDISDKQSVQDLFESHQFDTVINLAARAGVRYSLVNPYVYVSTNTLGSLHLLEQMKQYEIKKYVLASTSSLYAGQDMPFLETLPVNEPISPYAASKKAAEAMAYAYHHLFDIDVSIVRYFTVYGPAGRPDMGYFRFISQIDQGETLTLFGDGTQSRDFTYVDDIADGTIAAANHRSGFEIFNLGGGNQPFSINLVIEKIEQLLGKKANIEYRDFHKADMKSTWANIDKAESVLQWSPKIGLDEGLKRCVDWYVENKPWSNELELA